MKHFKHFLTILLLLCSTAASAHDFEVDGIYYNVLSEEDKTVAVTYSGSYSGAVADEYTGAVVIPATVTHNNITYSVTSIGQSFQIIRDFQWISLMCLDVVIKILMI